MNTQFGLDQIPSGFTGSINGIIMAGPGVWIGEMSILGVVPVPENISADSSYCF